jgi:uncharacterized protein (UPF0276 family)
MEVSINWSPQAGALLSAGRIRPDRFKCPDWPDLIATARSQRPVYVHFPLQVGAGKIAEADWSLVDRLLTETQTRFVNLHLNPRKEFFSEAATPEEIAALPMPARELVEARLIQEVAWVVQRFGADRVIVENGVYWGEAWVMPAAGVDPAVITTVVRETGCGLLLDLAHAWISAHHLGADLRQYLAAMPVDKLRELHVVGTHHDGQRWRCVNWRPSPTPRTVAGERTPVDVTLARGLVAGRRR